MKLGIIVDSATGLTKKEADKRGWGFLPLYLNIDDKDYAEGIDIESKSISKILNLDSKIRTSASTPAMIHSLFEDFSSKYDHVVVVSLSQELSSQNSNLIAFSKEFKNIHVINSASLSIGNITAAEAAEKAAKEGKKIEEIVKICEDTSKSFFGIVAPLTLDWLVKGGRINSSIASMANMLKIIPLIQISGGKLDKYGKGRTFKKSIIKILKVIREEDGEIMLLHSENENIDIIIEEIEKEIGQTIRVGYFPPSIVIHLGIGAVGIARCKKI